MELSPWSSSFLSRPPFCSRIPRRTRTKNEKRTRIRTGCVRSHSTELGCLGLLAFVGLVSIEPLVDVVVHFVNFCPDAGPRIMCFTLRFLLMTVRGYRS